MNALLNFFMSTGHRMSQRVPLIFVLELFVRVVIKG